MTPTEALLLVSRVTFKELDCYDREAFAGASDNARIGGTEEYTIIIDGNEIDFVPNDFDSDVSQITFTLSDGEVI
jgi:hypothetical protein